MVSRPILCLVAQNDGENASFQMRWGYFWALYLLLLRSYRIYYRKPYQNPKSQKCAGHFFSSSEKIFLLELKKILFYRIDVEFSYLSNGVGLRS